MIKCAKKGNGIISVSYDYEIDGPLFRLLRCCKKLSMPHDHLNLEILKVSSA